MSVGQKGCRPPLGERTPNYPLGVQSPCESLVKSVQFRAFRCIFVKNVRFVISKIAFSVEYLSYFSVTFKVSLYRFSYQLFIAKFVFPMVILYHKFMNFSITNNGNQNRIFSLLNPPNLF